MPNASPRLNTSSARSSEASAALESSRSTGIIPELVNHALDSVPRTPVPVKESAFARNTTLRGATIGITRLSAKDRWLLATITGPVGGMFSRPSTVGRQISFARGGTTASTTSYIMGPSVPGTAAVRRGDRRTDEPPPADPSLSVAIRRRVVTEVTGGPGLDRAGMGPGWGRDGFGWGRDGARLGSGPELALEPVFGLVDGALVGTGGEVLPTAVADHEDDVGALPCLERLRGLGERRVQDRTGGDPGKDAFELEQLPDASYGVPRPDREPGVDEGLVVQLRDEPLVEVAQTVDQLAVPRLGGDDPHLRLALAEETPGTHQSPCGAQPGDEVRHRRQVRKDLGAGALVVRQRVRRVAVLVEHDPVGVLVGDPLGDPDRLVGAAGGRGGHDLDAPHAQQLTPFLRSVLRHHADEPVALELGRHRQGDPGVAGRRLEDRATGPERAVLFGDLDHLQRSAVLDGTGWVLVLELGPQPDVGRGGEPGKADQRSVADRVEGRVEAHENRVSSRSCSAGPRPARPRSFPPRRLAVRRPGHRRSPTSRAHR